MAKLEIPVRVYMGELEEIINELKHLQTYKLLEGDDTVLVDCDEVVEIFANHLHAEILSDSTGAPDLSSYSDKLWRNAYERGRKEAAEEIIRCGECKYMMEDGRCWEFADDAIRPSVSDFCSHAERRKDG